MKKLISILLVAILIIGMFPATALTAKAAGGTFTRVTSVDEITAGGQFLIVGQNGSAYKAMPKTISSGKFSGATVTVSNNTITVNDDTLVWTVAKTGNGTVSLNNGSQYVAYNSSTNLKLQNAAYNFTITEPYNNDTFKVAATANTSRGIVFRAKTYNQFGGYATSNLSETGTEYMCLQFFKLGAGTTPDPEPECEHLNKTQQTVTEADCTTDGTYIWVCPDCDAEDLGGGTIPALGHNYVNGFCDREGCGERSLPGPEFPAIPESGNYQKITSLDEVKAGGQFVFVVEYEGAYYALGKTVTSNKLNAFATIINGNYVESTAPSWLVGSFEDGIVLKSTNYMGHTDSTNLAFSDTPFVWNVTDNKDGTFLLVSSSDAERAIAYNYNSGNPRFGAYDISNLDKTNYGLRLHVFKLTEGSAVEFKGELTFVENGKVTTVTPTYGSSYALPAATVTAPNGYTFAGWVEAALNETTVAPETYEVGASITVPASKTYYALYTRSETTSGGSAVEVFKKVTSAPANWVGTYLIVYETGKVAFDGSITTLDTASNTVSVTIKNDSITENVSNLKKSAFTIDASGNIKSAKGYYIGHTGSSNGLKSSTSTKYAHTLEIDGSGNAVITASTKYMLRYNNGSNQNRFRYYKTGQQAIQLYVLTEESSGGSTTTTYYTTTVAASCSHGKYNSQNATTLVCAYCGATKDAPVNVDGTSYETVEQAINAANGSIITLNQSIENITVTGELKLDLNGNTAEITAEKIYAYDSTATTSAKGTGKLVTESAVEIDNTVNGKRYIALKGENNTYTFHVLEIKLTTISLRTTADGMYYKATVKCDDDLGDRVTGFGTMLSLGAFPTSVDDCDRYTELPKESFSLNEDHTVNTTTCNLINILKESNQGAENTAAMNSVVYANLYVAIDVMGDGTKYDAIAYKGASEVTSLSLLQAVSYINDNWDTYKTAAAAANMKLFAEKWNKAELFDAAGYTAWQATTANILAEEESQ